MSIEQRLARLEKQNRIQRIALAIGACIIVCIVGVAAFPVDRKKPDRTIDFLKARKIVVQKSETSPKIILEANDEQATVSVVSEVGDNRATLIYSKKLKRSFVIVRDQQGRARIMAGVIDGEPLENKDNAIFNVSGSGGKYTIASDAGGCIATVSNAKDEVKGRWGVSKTEYISPTR